MVSLIMPSMAQTRYVEWKYINETVTMNERIELDIELATTPTQIYIDFNALLVITISTLFYKYVINLKISFIYLR